MTDHLCRFGEGGTKWAKAHFDQSRLSGVVDNSFLEHHETLVHADLIWSRTIMSSRKVWSLIERLRAAIHRLVYGWLGFCAIATPQRLEWQYKKKSHRFGAKPRPFWYCYYLLYCHFFWWFSEMNDKGPSDWWMGVHWEFVGNGEKLERISWLIRTILVL